MNQLSTSLLTARSLTAKPLTASSRLVRVLTELGALPIDAPQQNISQRLGDMIDFTGSVKLSEANGRVEVLSKKNKTEILSDEMESINIDSRLAELRASNTRCRESFVRVRKAAARFICQSFDKDNAQSRIKLPLTEFSTFIALESFSADSQALGKVIDPYQAFYAAHQQELAAKIQGLRTYVRELVSNSSAELANLVMLEQALEDVLAAGLRKSLKKIPKWLPGRFVVLFESFQNTTADLFDETSIEAGFGKTLNQFHSEMKDLLLAELELRLQPVLGLLEALNEEVNACT